MIAMPLPTETPPNPAINVAEALHAGWLELWYQPKIGMRMLALTGAEGMIRVRHPHWGVVPPAQFTADDGDPHFGTLCEFVVGRAVADWRSFVAALAAFPLVSGYRQPYRQHYNRPFRPRQVLMFRGTCG